MRTGMGMEITRFVVRFMNGGGYYQEGSSTLGDSPKDLAHKTRVETIDQATKYYSVMEAERVANRFDGAIVQGVRV